MRNDNALSKPYFLKTFRALCVVSLLNAWTPGLAQEAQAPKARPVEVPESLKKILAPSGSLRVGVYPGSPNSLIVGKTTELNAGVGFELGRAFAKYIGVPFEPVVYTMNGEVLAAAKEKKVDFIFSNATAVRSKYIDFADPVLLIEQGYIVRTASKITESEQIDEPGVKIGVSAGSTSEATLPGQLKYASIEVIPNLIVAQDKLNRGEIHAFATNKAILFEIADKLPGTTVLPGSWGYEKISVGIPKGREQALPFLIHFSELMLTSGFIKEAAQRAGLRGIKQD